MSQRDRASRLRQEIGQLAAEWNHLQKRMLRPGRMIRASLIARHLGTREKKRSSTAYYLSWAEGGKTILRHVAKEDVEGTRGKVAAWREQDLLQKQEKQWDRALQKAKARGVLPAEYFWFPRRGP